MLFFQGSEEDSGNTGGESIPFETILVRVLIIDSSMRRMESAVGVLMS